MSSDEKLKSTWASIFSRKGGPGECLRLWEDWDDSSRAAALRNVSLEVDELPVILSSSKTGGATLLTTRRLTCDFGTAPVQEVAGIKPVEFAQRQKDQLNELDIELSNGRSMRIAIEPGPSYFGMWNVLLNIARRNAHTTREPPST